MDKEKKVFIDTNILLHYKLFTEIDWCNILNYEYIRLYLTSTNLQELDNFKYDQNKKRKERARKVIKHISELDELEITTFRVRKDVILEIITAEPPTKIFSKYNLDPYVQDDRILAAIISFKENDNAEILILTDDINLRLKAKKFGIGIINLPEELSLTDEPDENEKEIKKLSNELLKYQKAAPDLIILFDNQTHTKEFSLKKPTIEKEEFIRQKMKEIKEKYPLKVFPNTNIHNPQLLNVVISGMYTEQDYMNYNDELKEYYIQYENYLAKKYTKESHNSHTLTIELLAANNGGSPADDIDIYFHFPDGFEIFSEYQFCEGLIAPKPPELSNSLSRMISNSHFTIPDYLTNTIQSRNINPPNVSGFSIKKTKSYDIQSAIRRLKHFNQLQLDTLFIIFASYEAAKSFSFDYRIIAANTPIEKKGKLNVIVKKVKDYE